MDFTTGKKKYYLLLGAILVFAGIGYTGHVMEWWQLRLFFAGWWTLFLIVPALVNFIKSGYDTLSMILFLAGVLLFANAQDIGPKIPLNKLWLPAILVITGISILLNLVLRPNHLTQQKAEKAERIQQKREEAKKRAVQAKEKAAQQAREAQARAQAQAQRAAEQARRSQQQTRTQARGWTPPGDSQPRQNRQGGQPNWTAAGSQQSQTRGWTPPRSSQSRQNRQGGQPNWTAAGPQQSRQSWNGQAQQRPFGRKIPNVGDHSNPEYFSVFSSSTVKNITQNLTGGDAISIFGDLNVDLQDARCRQNLEFSTVSVFGNVNLKVPDYVNVQVNPISIFGDHKCKVIRPMEASMPTLKVNCVSIFGSSKVF